MSVRNPTTFNLFVDESEIEQREIITTTAPSAVADDQVFYLDKESLILSAFFAPLSNGVEAAGAGWSEKRHFKIESKDMCGVAGVSNDEISHYLQIYAKVSGGATGQVKLVSSLATADGTATCTVTSATGAWVAAAAAMNVKTNANEDTLALSIQTSVGTGEVSVYGIALYAAET